MLGQKEIEMEHTPKWEHRSSQYHPHHEIWETGVEGRRIAYVVDHEPEAQDNAELIVKAVNSHDDLLTCCDVAYGLITKRDSHENVDVAEVVGMLKEIMDKVKHDYWTPRG